MNFKRNNNILIYNMCHIRIQKIIVYSFMKFVREVDLFIRIPN